MQIPELSRKHSDTSAALFTVAPLNSLSVPVVADKFAGKHFAKKGIDPERHCAQTKLSINEYTCA